MKSQSSLEVPKQIRSASFDEMQLQAKRQDDRTSSSSSTCSPVRSQDSVRGRRSSTLKVPQMQTGQRSKSFDAYSASSGSSSQLLPSGFDRPDTPIIQVSGCYHCACLEEYKSLWLAEDVSREETELGESYEAESGTDLSENESDDREDESRREGSPEILVTLTASDEARNEPARCVSPIVEIVSEPYSEMPPEELPDRQRRRSLASPKLARQEALTSFPLELPAAIPVRDMEPTIKTTVEVDEDDDDDENDVEQCKGKFIVRDIFLAVPDLKRDRAASVDSCFNNNKNGGVTDADSLAVPQQSIRSKSVDIVLPTDARTRYTALVPGKESRLPIGWVRLINGTDEPHHPILHNYTREDTVGD